MLDQIDFLDPCTVCVYPVCDTCQYVAKEEEKESPATVVQPMSIEGEAHVVNRVITDLHARNEYGRKKYGHPLQTFNGRVALYDAYQEALDLTQYLAQAIMEMEAVSGNLCTCFDKPSE